MKKLFLDDVRTTLDGFDIARSVNQFIEMIKQSDDYEIISLDYDTNCTMDGGFAASHIINEVKAGRLKKLKKVIIHSANSKGRAEMYDKLTKHLDVPVEIRILPQPDGWRQKLRQRQAAM